MGRGINVVSDHIEGFRKEVQDASTKDTSSFFNWFDESGGSAESTFIKGQCEFALYILTPLMRRLGNTKDKIALEIGHGGGRLLAAAAQIFKTVIGVDIHPSSRIVADELSRRNIHNFALLQNSGTDIPLRDASIDLVYSFIVFQHLERMTIFQNYLVEVNRVLKPSGYAVLFFGRLSSLSAARRSRVLYYLDRVRELMDRTGYREHPARVNTTNLTISLPFAKRKCKQVGFVILGEGVSRRLPDLAVYGTQHFLILGREASQ